jgi:ribosomal protein S4
MEIPAIKKLLETKKLSIPDWLARKAVVGKVKRLPVVDDISEPISTQDIIEFYSR